MTRQYPIIRRQKPLGRNGVTRTQAGARRLPIAAMPSIAIAAALCALLKLFSVGHVSTTAQTVIAELVAREGAVKQLLDLELGAPDGAAALSAFIGTAHGDSGSDEAQNSRVAATIAPDSPIEKTPRKSNGIHTPRLSPMPSQPQDSTIFDAIEQPPTLNNSAPLSADGIIIKNNSGLDIDAAALLQEPLDITLATDAPSVLIIHTHGSEAYTKGPGETYEESDPYRTENKEFSIIRVGDELAEALAERGIGVIHDRTLYDYPSYAGAYGRSLSAATQHLSDYPSISLVIDLHRDAMETSDGGQFKTIAEINSERCSQVMLVVGTNGSGLNHPQWRENLKLALRLEHEMNRMYPTLARPITLAEHRYNQHLTNGSLIVEIGASGNTLSESITAANYFAEVYSAVVTA